MAEARTAVLYRMVLPDHRAWEEAVAITGPSRRRH